MILCPQTPAATAASEESSPGLPAETVGVSTLTAEVSYNTAVLVPH